MKNILKKVPVKSKKIAWRKVGNETILVPLENVGKKDVEVKILNSVSGYIWSLIDDDKTVEEIIHSTYKVYSGNPKEIKKDIINYILKLESEEFINMK